MSWLGDSKARQILCIPETAVSGPGRGSHWRQWHLPNPTSHPASYACGGSMLPVGCEWWKSSAPSQHGELTGERGCNNSANVGRMFEKKLEQSGTCTGNHEMIVNFWWTWSEWTTWYSKVHHKLISWKTHQKFTPHQKCQARIFTTPQTFHQILGQPYYILIYHIVGYMSIIFRWYTSLMIRHDIPHEFHGERDHSSNHPMQSLPLWLPSGNQMWQWRRILRLHHISVSDVRSIQTL